MSVKAGEAQDGHVLKTATLPAGLALLSPGFTLRSRLQRPLLVAGPAPAWTVLSMRRWYLDDVMPPPPPPPPLLLLLLLGEARSERCPRQERMAA